MNVRTLAPKQWSKGRASPYRPSELDCLSFILWASEILTGARPAKSGRVSGALAPLAL